MTRSSRLCEKADGAWREEGGSVLVEMAFTLPVLFTFIFCFMEICLAFYSKDMISECAREGTRYAIYHGSSCPNTSNPTCEATASQVNTYVSGLGWPNLGAGTMVVNTTYPNGNENPGSQVKIVVSYTLPIQVPFVPTADLTFSSTSQMRILQ